MRLPPLDSLIEVFALLFRDQVADPHVVCLFFEVLHSVPVVFIVREYFIDPETPRI
jgi:hypothetical protein